MSIQDELRAHGEGVYEGGVHRMMEEAADHIDSLERTLNIAESIERIKVLLKDSEIVRYHVNAQGFPEKVPLDAPSPPVGTEIVYEITVLEFKGREK